MSKDTNIQFTEKDTQKTEKKNNARDREMKWEGNFIPFPFVAFGF